MFGRKKIEKNIEVNAKIQVIPDDFYGTKDPVVHYASNGNKSVQIKKENFGEATHGLGRNGFGGFFQNKKSRIILAVSFFVLSVGVISWYYINQATKSSLPTTSNNKGVEVENTSPPVVEEVVTSTLSETTSTVESVVIPESPTTTLESNKLVILDFPSMLLDNSPDADFDSLSDAEEFIFGTDNTKWDTDGDGYYDGLEVFNLYNPAGVAPMKIVDSGLAKEYVNPIWQYRVYYPAQWAAAAVDSEAKQVLLSALSGDYVEVFAEQKDSAETFSNWFGRRAVGQQYSDLVTITNRYKEIGLKRKDDLTAYFIDGDKIYTIIYHPGSTGSIMYRHVMQMIVQSFRPARTLEVLPEQQVLPPEPGNLDQSGIINATST